MRVLLANGVHSSSADGGLSSALATSLRYKVVDIFSSGTKSDWVLPAKVCSLSPCNVVAPGIHFGASLSLSLSWVTTDGGTCMPPPVSPNLISTRDQCVISG